MLNPLMALITLQLTIVNRCFAMTRDMLDLYLSLQPVPMKTATLSASRSLVSIDRPTTRQSR